MISGIFVTLVVSVVAKILAVWLPFLGAEAIAMLIGIVLPFIWIGRLDFAFGICFGSGLAHFGMGMHKRYNNK